MKKLIFRIINRKALSVKDENGKPYYASIVKVLGLRTALIDDRWGQRTIIKFIKP